MSNKNVFLAITAIFVVAGCNSDGDPSQSSLQAVHAAADAPRTNIWINNEATLVGVDYGVASGYLSVPGGRNSVQVDAQLPANMTATVIPDTDLTLSPNSKYTVMVVGEADPAGSAPLEALVVERPARGEADEGTLDVQVVHAAAGVADVDLYVTAPGADISAASALDTLAFKDDSGVLNIAATSYQIRLTLAGTKTVAYDSGTVALAANSELTIAAIPNPDSDAASPVMLLVMDGSEYSTLYDVAENAEIQVGHLVDDAPVVDVSLNGSEAISDLSFKDVTAFTTVSPGSYDVGVYPDNTPGTLVIDAQDVEFNAGMDYGVFAVGALSSIEALVVESDRRMVATSAKLSVVHAASSAPLVDVYLTASADISVSEPALADFAFKQDQQSIYVAAGDYYVTVTPADSKAAAIGPVMVSVSDGVVYQAIAIDDNSGFDLLLSDITD